MGSHEGKIPCPYTHLCCICSGIFESRETCPVTSRNALTQSNQHASVRGADVPSKLDFIFTHSSFGIENITCKPRLGKGYHLLPKVDYIGKEEVLENRKSTPNIINYKGRNYEALKAYFKETDWEAEFQNLGVEQWYIRL